MKSLTLLEKETKVIVYYHFLNIFFPTGERYARNKTAHREEILYQAHFSEDLDCCN